MTRLLITAIGRVDMNKSRRTTVLLVTSLLLNVLLAAIAGNLWLQRRASHLGLSSNSEALRSLAGASVLPSVRIEFRVGEEQPGPGVRAKMTLHANDQLSVPARSRSSDSGDSPVRRDDENCL